MTLHDFVKARLKVLYPEVTLSNARIKATADKLSTKQLTVEQEAEVDAALTAMNDNGQYTFAELQKEDSRILQLQILADKGNKKNDPTKDQDPEKKSDDDMPEWFKNYKAETDAKLQAFEKEKTQGTLKQKLVEKLKDVPQDFYSEWALPENEEGLDAFTEKVTTKFASFKQQAADKGFAIVDPPKKSDSSAASTKVNPDIVAFAQQVNKEAIKK